MTDVTTHVSHSTDRGAVASLGATVAASGEAGSKSAAAASTGGPRAGAERLRAKPVETVTVPDRLRGIPFS